MPDEQDRSLATHGLPAAPRAEALLGARLDRVTEETLQFAVSQRTREDQSLDWKRDLYDGKTIPKLAKGVAAMANASGGVVVFGVDEDDQARASALKPVTLSDENHRKLVDAVIRLIAPVPEYAVHAVPAAEDGLGYYLVVVAASPLSPHAVLEGERLTYPVREQTQTRNMREPEIAARYRDRFRLLNSRAQRLSSVHSDGLKRIPRSAAQVWLTLSCTPEQPGRADISSRAVAESRQWLRSWQQEHTPRQAFAADCAATTGRQRIIHSSQYEYAGTSQDWHLELHADGSGYGAIRLAPEPVRLERMEGQPPVHAVPLRELESFLPTLLSLLAQHAVRAASGGALLVSCQIVSNCTPDEEWVAADGLVNSAAAIHPTLTVTNPVSGRPQRVTGTLSVPVPELIEQTMSRSVAWDPHDLVSGAAQIAGELLSEFGLPDPLTISRNGGVHDGPHTDAGLISWARRHEVPVTASD